MFGLTKSKNALRKVWAGRMSDHVIAMDWSADGKNLAAAATTGPVTIFDAGVGSGDVHLSGHANGALTLGWSPASNILATGGKDRRVRLWDPNGAESACLETDASWVEQIVWHPDGSMVAASVGKIVHIWNSRGEHSHDLTDHPSTVSDLAWKPKSNTLAALVYGGVMLWTIRGEDPPSFRLFPWKGSPLRMAWSPNAAMLAHGNQDSTVHFWYAKTAEELQMSGFPTKVRELSWDPTSRYLATGGGPAVCIWDCGGKGPAGSKPQMLEGHAEDSALAAVAYQQWGRLLASAGTDGRVCVWEPQKKKQPLVGEFLGAGGEATALRWSPDDKLLAVGFESGDVSVFTVS